MKSAAGSDKVTPMSNEMQGKEEVEQTLSAEDMLSNTDLISRVKQELNLCEDRKKDPKELFKECNNVL